MLRNRGICIQEGGGNQREGGVIENMVWVVLLDVNPRPHPHTILRALGAPTHGLRNVLNPQYMSVSSGRYRPTVITTPPLFKLPGFLNLQLPSAPTADSP